jgi:hypothetical protein
MEISIGSLSLFADTKVQCGLGFETTSVGGVTMVRTELEGPGAND